jgi:hypothetical protein
MKLSLRVVCTMLPLTAGIASFSQSINNVVTSAVPFLRISPDARAGSMGDIGVATSPDANSSFWNVAKTPFIEGKGGLSLTYTPWLKDLGVNDVYLASLGGYYKIDDQSAVTASLRYFNLGQIQFTDFSGNSLGSGKPTEVAFDIGYSRKLTEKWGVGASLRYINSNLARGFASNSGVTIKAGNTVAGDIGVFYNGVNDIGQGWRFGLALSNLGGRVSYTSNALERDYLPANMGLGASYTAVIDENNKIMVGLDINKLMVPTPPIAVNTGNEYDDSLVNANALNNYYNKGLISSWFSSFGDSKNEFKEYQFSLGAEYAYAEQFFVRAGYFYEDKTKGNRKYFSAGVGLKFNVFGLNLSYLVPSGNGTNRNPLSNTLRFSLLFDFANAEN